MTVDLGDSDTPLKCCTCGVAGPATFSPLSDLFHTHVVPEMLYLETLFGQHDLDSNDDLVSELEIGRIPSSKYLANCPFEGDNRRMDKDNLPS